MFERSSGAVPMTGLQLPDLSLTQLRYQVNNLRLIKFFKLSASINTILQNNKELDEYFEDEGLEIE
jgi:hypothetical protein